MTEDSRAARRAQRAARMRRRRIRRLSVTATVVAVLAAGGVLALRPAADIAPQVSGGEATAAPTVTGQGTPDFAPEPLVTVPPPVTPTKPGAPVADAAASAASPSAEPKPRPSKTRASRDQAPAERTQRRARTALPAAKLPVISEGDYGTVIAAAQRALDVEPTGYFGPKTHTAVVEYQESIGLPTTGQIATFTWAALGAKTVRVALKAAGTPDGFTEGEPADLQESPSPRPVSTTVAVGEPPILEETDSGEAVAVVQRALGVKPATGYFGPKTAAAVRSFQSDNGLPSTGMIATYTWTALGTRIARAAAGAHAEFGTAFGPGAPGSSGGGNNGGNSNGGNNNGGNNNGGNNNGGNNNGGNNGGGSSGSTSGSGGLFCPVATFSYGDGLGAPRPGGRLHAGLDLMGSRGEPIYSIASGTVTRAGYQSNGSLILDITGPNGMFFYGHFDSIVVGYGDRIAPGQLIGYMGDTGSPGAVHLHLEVRPYGWSGGYEDPVPLIRSLCG